jgi:CheY-like chemotaxis protein
MGVEMKSTTAPRASYLDFASGELHDRPIALVVHGSPTVRRALLVTLDLDGFDVRTVDDASEAVVRLSEEQPQVVIAEMGLECADVANLFSQLRSNAATRRVPLVLFTASAAATSAREWSISGVHHVPLTLGLDRLLDVLHETVDPLRAEA